MKMLGQVTLTTSGCVASPWVAPCLNGLSPRWGTPPVLEDISSDGEWFVLGKYPLASDCGAEVLSLSSPGPEPRFCQKTAFCARGCVR